MEESQWGGRWHWLSLASKDSIRLCEVCLTQRRQSHPLTRLKSEYALGYYPFGSWLLSSTSELQDSLVI
jgi:hypothetical protein